MKRLFNTAIVAITLLFSLMAAAGGDIGPGGMPGPNIQTYEDITIHNPYGALVVKQVYLNGSLLETERRFNASSGGVFKITTNARSSYKEIESPSSHISLVELNESTIQITNKLNGETRTIEIDPVNPSDIDASIDHIATDEAWMQDYRDFLELESAKLATASLLKPPYNLFKTGPDPIASCDDKPDCDGWAFLNLFSAAVGGSYACYQSLGLLCAVATANFISAGHDYDEKCGNCSPFENRDEPNNDPTEPPSDDNGGAEECTSSNCGNSVSLNGWSTAGQLRCKTWYDYYTNGQYDFSKCIEYVLTP